MCIRDRAKTESELKSLAGTLGANWKPDGVGSSSVNGGYPVLGWQELNPGPVKLATPGNPVWKADERGLLTPVATWSPVENAQSYTCLLYTSRCV